MPCADRYDTIRPLSDLRGRIEDAIGISYAVSLRDMISQTSSPKSFKRVPCSRPTQRKFREPGQRGALPKTVAVGYEYRLPGNAEHLRDDLGGLRYVVEYSGCDDGVKGTIREWKRFGRSHDEGTT